MIVQAAVKCGMEGQFIPFFGVERKGSPVFGYLRLSNKEIRRKTQIYEPDVVVVMDDSLTLMPETYAGIKKNGVVVINTEKPLEKLEYIDIIHLSAPPITYASANIQTFHPAHS